MSELRTDMFQAVFQQSDQALCLADTSGRCIDVNASFLALSGLQREQLEGALVSSVFAACCPKNGTEVLLDDNWQGLVALRTSPDEKRWILRITRLSPAAGASGFLVALSGVGRTSREDTYSEYQQRKLESIGILASSVAHDLNNILTGVLGHISYLRLSQEEIGCQAESITAIEHGARRAASLTRQILDFARGESAELRTVNLSLVVAAGINLLRASLPENVELSFTEEAEDIYVCGEESQLSQLVLNLTVNAKDALPNGGRIEIALNSAQGRPPADAEGADPEVHYARLTIKDNGLGIPKPLQERIFEPFFTTKQSGGTGLGLATVSSIVRAHRGIIRLESSEGQGSCFDIYLPLSAAAASSPEIAKAEQVKPSSGSERILVVDDEESVRIVMQRSLEHLGYEVIVAPDGEHALELLRTRNAAFDLIIIDMIMPNMAGDELFRRLREIDPDASVLVASGYSSDGRTKALLEKGALGFIPKPFAIEELAAEVRRCLDTAA